MLVSEKLVLVPLHKDGVTAVQNLLQATVGGESRKQLGSAAELAALGVPVVGFVCSPLTWYLALWRQGCAGKGGLYRRLTDDARWQRVLSRQQARHQAEDAAAQPAGAARAGLPLEWSAAHATTVWYADRENALAFREWLRAVLGTRAMRRIVEAQPSATSGLRAGGLMTQEYLSAFVNAPEDESISTLKLDGLQALDQRSAIAQMFVRAEAASADVAAVLDQLGVARSPEQDEAIRALVPDAGAEDSLGFYDADSLHLVAQHERLIIAKFGYELASTTPAEGAKADRARSRKRKERGKEISAVDESGASPDSPESADLNAAGEPGTPKRKGRAKGKQQGSSSKKQTRASTASAAEDATGSTETPDASGPRAARAGAAKASTGGRVRRRSSGKDVPSADSADPATGSSTQD